MIFTDQIELFLGEQRTIAVDFYSCDGSSFNLRNARYRLKFNGTVEIEGELNPVEHTLQVLIKPERIGRYDLEFQVEIANEIVIRRISVYVRK